MNIRALHLDRGLLVVSLLTCSACSGGGGGHGGTGGSGGPGAAPASDRFLLFAGSLKAVDPLDPTTPFLIEADEPAGLDRALEGDFDPATGTLENAAFGRVAYGKGNRVLGVDLGIERVGGVALAPVAEELAVVSGEVVDLRIEEDFSISGESLTYVVETVGGVHEVFTQVDGVLSAPLPFPGTPVESLLDASDGSFQGWLALEGGALTRVGTDLTSSFLAPADHAQELGRTVDGDVFLLLDGRLASYDLEQELLVDLFHDFVSSSLVDVHVAGDTLYFTTVAGLSGELMKTDVDGPVLPLEAVSNALIEDLNVSESRVVYVVRSLLNGENSLHSVTLEGADPLELFTTEAEVRFAFDGMASTGDQVFYNTATQDGAVNAYAVQADGSDRIEHAGSAWLYPRITPEAQLDRPVGIAALLLFTPGGPTLGTLDSVDPTDATTVLQRIGEVPAAFHTFLTVPSFDPLRLGTGVSGTLPDTIQSDVFLIDSGPAGSVLQVTDTPGESEVALF